MNALNTVRVTTPLSAPDLRSYDRIVVAFSGGKDSIASLLTVLEPGVPSWRRSVRMAIHRWRR